MSSSTIQLRAWNKWEVFTFRAVFIFLLLLSIPTDGEYYKEIFSAHSLQSLLQDIYQLTHTTPAFIRISNWGLASYAGWLIALIIGVTGAFIWGLFDKRDRINYDHLYYWSRAVLRYRLAIAFIASGVILILPLQLPYPTLSDLHTAYGDFLPWKIYYHSTAVATAGYRETIGFIEIAGALLLLNRKTTAFGAIILSFILINIVLANFAYEIGDHLYSSYLLLIAAILIVYDYKRLYSILVSRTKAFADRFRPAYGEKIGKIRKPLKLAFILFAVFIGALAFASYRNTYWLYPQTAGLKDAEGVYNVSSFKINDTLLPYSLTDTVRWQDVVFEKWNTLSVRDGQTHLPNLSSPSVAYQPEASRNYEFIGNGGRVFYSYHQHDKVIELNNRNDSADRITFSIDRPDKATIRLNGKNSKGDSLWIILDKLDKEYLLKKGRRKPVSVY